MSAKPASRTMMAILAMVAVNALVLMMLERGEAPVAEAPPAAAFATQLELVAPENASEGAAPLPRRAREDSASASAPTRVTAQGARHSEGAAEASVEAAPRDGATAGPLVPARVLPDPDADPAEPVPVQLAIKEAERVRACLRWGPFDDQKRAEQLLSRLEGQGLTGFDQSSELVEKKPHYPRLPGPVPQQESSRQASC